MRLNKFIPADLTAEQLSLYNEIKIRRSKGVQKFALENNSGALEGPFNAMLLSPKVGFALQALGAAIRYDSTLSPRVREGSILMVATKWNSEFELAAHEPIALDCGISESEIKQIRLGESLAGKNEGEKASFEVTTKLIEKRDLNDSEFASYSALIGNDTIFEISSLVGYYSTLALQLRIFRV